MNKPYDLGLEAALAHARETLRSKYGPEDAASFEDLIDRFIAEIVEDPTRAIQRSILPDARLAEGIKASLKGPPLSDSPETLLIETKRRQATLAAIEDGRFLEGQIQTAAVPDGNGSYLIDTVGTPGRWKVIFTAEEPTDTAAASVTRLLDALCDIRFTASIPQDYGHIADRLTGEDDQLVIIDDVLEADRYLDEGSTLCRPSDSAFADSIAAEILEDGHLRLYAASRLLTLSRRELRDLLRDAFPTMAPVTPTTEERRSLSPRSVGKDLETETLPGVVMLDFSGTSGPYLVAHALEMRGYPTQVVKPGEQVALDDPAVFCVSLATQPLGLAGVGDQLKSLRAAIDEHFPGSFIIMGGPSAKHPKAAIALYPEVNILLRGEGEEVLPEVLRIIGRTRTTDGLSREQIAALKNVDGLFLHTPGFMMFNNLDRVNAPHDFDVPVMFHYGSFSLYGGGNPITSRTIINPDIARGCPFRCNFCSMAMGWKQRYVAFEKFQQYVLGMLAMEIPLPPATEDAIAAALREDAATSEAARDYWFPADAYEFPKSRLADVANLLNRSLTVDLSSRGLLAADARLFDGEAMEGLLGSLVCQRSNVVTRSQVNEVIVAIRRRWLAVLLEKDEDLYEHGLDHKLEILLEDDNTLCNREYIEVFCRWVIDSGLNRYMRFGGGQTSVSSFLRKGKPDEAFIGLLREAGCLEVEMGVDGLSNNTLKQNDKRGYRLGNAIQVLVALTRHGINAASNRLYSAPYSSRIDLVESLLMGAIAPLGGHSLGGVFIITVPGSQYTNEFAVLFPDRAANAADFEETYGTEYAYAWANFPEYVPLEHHLYPYAPEAGSLIVPFASTIEIKREDKYLYDQERAAGAMTHELGILAKLEAEGLESEVEEVIRRWQADEQTDPEMKALGEIIRIRRNQEGDVFNIFRGILAETYSPGNPKTFTDILNDTEPNPPI